MSAIAAAMVLAGCTDETTGSEETLTLTEVDKGSHFAPIGNADAQGHEPPGSGFALSIPLQDSSHDTVGEINAVCIATRPASSEPVLSGTCTGTADAPDGQLALIAGGDEIGQDVTGAIVGGTDKYEGATGTFSSKSPGPNTIDTFNITLP
ncbi:MAG: hypothetical protein ACRDK1_09820 [Solirubrobacterales bacterium]